MDWVALPPWNTQDHKTAQEIALKRYGFIAPFVSGNIDTYK